MIHKWDMKIGMLDAAVEDHDSCSIGWLTDVAIIRFGFEREGLRSNGVGNWGENPK